MTADPISPPDAFFELVSAFNQGLFDVGLPTPSDAIRGALQFLSEAQKQEARAFISRLLASGAPDEELSRIWRESDSQIYVDNGIRAWFEEILANL